MATDFTPGPSHLSAGLHVAAAPAAPRLQPGGRRWSVQGAAAAFPAQGLALLSILELDRTSLKWERSRKWTLPKDPEGPNLWGARCPQDRLAPSSGLPCPHGLLASPQSDVCRALVRAAAELTLPPQLPLQSSGVRGREGRAGNVRVTRRGHRCPPLRMEQTGGPGPVCLSPKLEDGLQGRAGVRRQRLANLGASGADVAPLEPPGGRVAARRTCTQELQ